MGLSYGDVRTAGNGIWLWLQGVRNHRKGLQGPNYIPRQLDINQKDKFVRELVIAFLASKGVVVNKKQMYNNGRKYYALVQKQFHQFVIYVKENYEPTGTH